MKKLFIQTLFMILGMGIIGSCKDLEITANNSSVSISNTDAYYFIESKFKSVQTDEVYAIINSFAKPTIIFKSTHSYVEADIKLDDKLNMFIKSGKGRIYLRFDKNKNDDLALKKVITLGEKLTNLLQ